MLSVIVFVALLLVVSISPISGNIKTLAVLSGSMEPTIHTGSLIIIKPVSDYIVGDIITFGKNTKIDIPTTHRIAEVKMINGETIYATKGDANNSEDGKDISKKDIIGKVYFSIPYLGYIVNFVKNPMGLLIVIIIPAVVIIYDEILKIKKEVSLMKEKNDVVVKEIKNERRRI